MTITAETMAHGEIDGIVWYELPIEALNGKHGKVPPEGHDSFIALALEVPSRSTLDYMFKNIGNYRHGPIGPFIPFDAEHAFPGRIVACATHAFPDEGVTRWMNEHAGIPDGLDLEFQTYGRGIGDGRRLTAIARTLKKGRPANVRRALDHSLPAREALAKEIPWLLKNCPRADDGAIGCTAHVAHLISRLTPAGARRVKAWIDDQTANRDIKEVLTIGEFFLPGSGARRLKLSMTVAGLVRGEIELPGNHLVKDDDKGVEIEIRQRLPDTLVNGLKGTPLSRIIDIPWLESVVITTPRGWDEGKQVTTLRASVAGVPFILPDTKDRIDDEAAMKPLLDLAGHGEREWAAVTRVSASAIPALAGMGRAEFLSLVEMMRVEGQTDLALFDRPGWKLRLRGDEIVVDTSPTVAFTDFLRDQMKMDVPE